MGTVTNVFVPGSVVKAATISSGWENGVLSGNQTLTDQPYCFPRFSSNLFLGINWHMDLFLLQLWKPWSIHLMLTWFKPLLESWARPINQICLLEPAIWETAMGKLRSTFAEYGLGASTGIDLPNESTGFIPKSIISLITLPMHLVSLITTPQCNWPSMLELLPTTVFGLHLTLSKGIYGNNEQGGL